MTGQHTAEGGYLNVHMSVHGAECEQNTAGRRWDSIRKGKRNVTKSAANSTRFRGFRFRQIGDTQVAVYLFII